MNSEYEQGQHDMLVMLKDAYYRADKKTFEQLIDTGDEGEVWEFLNHEYAKECAKIERTRLLGEIGELARKYGIKI